MVALLFINSTVETRRGGARGSGGGGSGGHTCYITVRAMLKTRPLESITEFN